MIKAHYQDRFKNRYFTALAACLLLIYCGGPKGGGSPEVTSQKPSGLPDHRKPETPTQLAPSSGQPAPDPGPSPNEAVFPPDLGPVPENTVRLTEEQFLANFGQDSIQWGEINRVKTLESIEIIGGPLFSQLSPNAQVLPTLKCVAYGGGITGDPRPILKWQYVKNLKHGNLIRILLPKITQKSIERLCAKVEFADFERFKLEIHFIDFLKNKSIRREMRFQFASSDE